MNRHPREMARWLERVIRRGPHTTGTPAEWEALRARFRTVT